MDAHGSTVDCANVSIVVELYVVELYVVVAL